METVLAILMVLGIYLAIPAVIGFAVGTALVWKTRRAQAPAEAERLARQAFRA